MHISEGVLSAPVLVSGAVLTAACTAIGLKKVDYDRIPQVAVLSAAFFVASLVHVPIGPASVHLLLTGLVGLFLGWGAFPAILVGLTFQTLLFQFGGLTSLGVNTMNMALPALISFYVFRAGVRSKKTAVSMTASFLCGFGSVFMGSLMTALSLFFTGEAFLVIAKIVVVAHLPVMVIEGIITAFCVKFLKQVKPEMLETVYAR
ncbi:MAG: cobalt transporter CbiM [Deltaproteobacteria bacterium]|nr:cobalt transporter CbiM [Deltaproteobacteria bacterium]